MKMYKFFPTILLGFFIFASAAIAADPGNYYFTADWCPGCQVQGKVIKSLEKMGYRFTVYDADKDRDAFKNFNITAIPMVVVVKDKDTIIKLKGQQPARVLMRVLIEETRPFEVVKGPEPIKKIKDAYTKLKDKKPARVLITQLLDEILSLLEEKDNTK